MNNNIYYYHLTKYIEIMFNYLFIVSKLKLIKLIKLRRNHSSLIMWILIFIISYIYHVSFLLTKFFGLYISLKLKTLILMKICFITLFIGLIHFQFVDSTYVHSLNE